MPIDRVLENDFASGEISPRLLGQVRSKVYQSGASLMYNAMPMRGGGWRRRPGTRKVDIVSSGTAWTGGKIVDFYSSDGTPFQLLIVPGGDIDVYSLATRAKVATIALTTSYAAADCRPIIAAQTMGETWLFHRGYSTIYITNSAADGSGTWSVTTPTFSGARTFSSAGNYPGFGEFQGGRLVLGSTTNEPMALFESALTAAGTAAVTSYNFTNFDLGTGVDSDAIYYLSSDMNAPQINWAFDGQDRLLVGTDRSVFMELTPPATPATFGLKRNSAFGTNGSKPRQVVHVACYISANQKQFRSLILNLYRGYYDDADLSENSDHLLSRQALDFAVTLHPEPNAWLMMADGTLVSAGVQQADQGFTIKAGAGFAQHQLGGSGKVLAIGAVHNELWDELWMLVNRGTQTALEYLYLDDINQTALEDAYYFDCGETVTDNAGSKTIAGLTWLEGSTVGAMLDGSVAAAVTVDSSGNAVFPVAITKAQVGLRYYSAVQNVRPELPAQGTSQGVEKKLEESVLRLYNSSGGLVGITLPADPLSDTSGLQPVRTAKYGVQLYGSPPDLFSGDVRVPISGTIDEDGRCYVVCVDGRPFNLVAMVNRYGIMET